MTENVAKVRVTRTPDPDHDLSHYEQDCFNEAVPGRPDSEGEGLRLIEEYSRGEWWGIVVTVETLCEHGGVIAGASCWGIDYGIGTPAEDDLLVVEVAEELARELAVTLDSDTIWEEG